MAPVGTSDFSENNETDFSSGMVSFKKVTWFSIWYILWREANSNQMLHELRQ